MSLVHLLGYKPVLMHLNMAYYGDNHKQTAKPFAAVTTVTHCWYNIAGTHALLVPA